MYLFKLCFEVLVWHVVIYAALLDRLGKVDYTLQFFRDRFKMNSASILTFQELADIHEPFRRDVYS